MEQLKKIDLETKNFTANGTEYVIENELSIQKSVFAEAAKLELERGVRIGSQAEDWKKVYDLCNENKLADIAVMAYNNTRGFKDFFKQHHAVIRLCACYINYKGEDRRYINDDAVNKKATDWQEEGYSMDSFFLLALAILKRAVEDCGSAMHDILETIKEYNQMIQEEKLNIPIYVL